MELDGKQREAVDLSINMKNRVVGIHGEAGTGKTKILKEIYEHFHTHGIEVAAFAPTGKAARRIKEATGIDAMTIHRGLRYPHPGEIDEKTGKPMDPGHPYHDRQNPLKAKVILCDEYAMVNDEIHRNLMAAIPPGGVVRVFGDVNQLRPIEETLALRRAPSHFESLLSRKDLNSVRLETNWRSGDGSNIPKNGKCILVGRPPQRYDDFGIAMTDSPVTTMAQLLHDGDEAERYASFDAQIISPSKKSWVGTDKLNAYLQQHVFHPMLNPELMIPLERHSWDKTVVSVAVGDKVLWNANNYDLHLFNGEIGIIRKIARDGDIEIDWGDRVIVIPPVMNVRNQYGATHLINPQRDLSLAYVVTTHKGQGSEWQEVTYVMNKSVSFICNRRNFYTGITRARKKVRVISDNTAMSVSLWKKGDE